MNIGQREAPRGRLCLEGALRDRRAGSLQRIDYVTLRGFAAVGTGGTWTELDESSDMSKSAKPMTKAQPICSRNLERADSPCDCLRTIFK